MRRVIPSGGPKAPGAHRRWAGGIAVVPIEGPSTGTTAIPRLALALARNDSALRRLYIVSRVGQRLDDRNRAAQRSAPCAPAGQ